jgi:cytochrome c biogenesis protein CcmG, thiol:disulfide interchange protein DsbE
MPRINPLMAIPPVLFLALAALFLAGNFREDRDALPSAREGQPAPPMVLGALAGRGAPFTDDTLREPGVKLVNYWASWCAPCRAEHPMLEALAEEGIPIYGINYKDTPGQANAFLDELGDFFAAHGTDAGRTGIDWGLYGVPETYVIDGEGTIVLRFAGPITRDAPERRIRPALEAAAAR